MTETRHVSLYSKEHPPLPPKRGLLDDTLDAYPPTHLYSDHPTPEAIAAARKLMEERGIKPEGKPVSGGRRSSDK